MGRAIRTNELYTALDFYGLKGMKYEPIDFGRIS
jgi:hypothetical protein